VKRLLVIVAPFVMLFTTATVYESSRRNYGLGCGQKLGRTMPPSL
jgi:hypothetical protein